VIFDLEAQERVHGGERRRIARDDAHPSAERCFLVLIGDAVLEPRHVRSAGHLLRMRQGRLAEVSRFEQSGDLLEVLSDGVKICAVAGLLHGNVDGSAVLVKQEVMERALLIEAHGLRAAREHLLVMDIVIRPRRWLLRPCRGRQPCSSRNDGEYVTNSMSHRVPPSWQ
jgi:hypothetical protein